MIGPRLSMLVMSLVPVISTLLAWIFLKETLSGLQIFGILLTLAGISWVILERNGAARATPLGRAYFLGLLFALGGATGQSLGLITAKFGLYGDFSPISANMIRMLVAAITLWAVTILRRQGRITFNSLRKDRIAIRNIFFGSLAGPFLGVSFSLLAIQRAPVGIASTLMALTPVFLLPISYYVFDERFGWQAVAGTLLAVIGVAVLFLA
jgi:drug/metabolite transporter (DMT)-like permease